MSERGSTTRDARGFALLVVLWFLVLISAVGIYLIASARTETEIAHNVHLAAVAEALADAGVSRAAFNAMDPVAAHRWKTDGSAYLVDLPSGRVEVRLEDETTKINPNTASEALLTALFEISGIARLRARHLGAAVADWVSPDGQAREFGAKLEQYRAAGRSYGPPNTSIESLDELELVLGMTPEIFASVRPYLTIYTSADQPNLNGASPVVQRAVALAAQIDDADQTGDQAAVQTTNADAIQSQPQSQPLDEHVFSVVSTGYGNGGGVFTRCAVLRLDADEPNGYAMLDWRRCNTPETNPLGGARFSD